MRLQKQCGKVLCVLALFVIALAVPVGALCHISTSQQVQIEAPFDTVHSWVIFYNYSTAGISYHEGFGTYPAGYTAPTTEWLGIFLYDADLGTYQDAFYQLLQPL